MPDSIGNIFISNGCVCSVYGRALPKSRFCRSAAKTPFKKPNAIESQKSEAPIESRSRLSTAFTAATVGYPQLFCPRIHNFYTNLWKTVDNFVDDVENAIK